MPWSKTNVPPAASKLKGKKLEIFVAAANSALKEYDGDEGRAIATGLAAAKKYKGNVKKSMDESENENIINIAKSVDEEKQIFTAVVLRPNVADGQGDIYDESVVEEACHEYNVLCRKANLHHLIEFEKAYPIESYIAPADFELGKGQVLKGDWVMSMKIEDSDIWELCKQGEFTGFSVGCKGKGEIISDE